MLLVNSAGIINVWDLPQQVETPTPKPETRNPTPETRHPKPEGSSKSTQACFAASRQPHP